jgi:hypothetical protein
VTTKKVFDTLTPDLVHLGLGCNFHIFLSEEICPDIDEGLVAVEEAGVRFHLIIIAPRCQRLIVDISTGWEINHFVWILNLPGLWAIEILEP